jgi:hypothetical protein
LSSNNFFKFKPVYRQLFLPVVRLMGGV